MIIYFGPPVETDLEHDSMFKDPSGKPWYYKLSFTKSNDFESVVLEDTCNRSIPISTDDISSLIYALQIIENSDAHSFYQASKMFNENYTENTISLDL